MLPPLQVWLNFLPLLWVKQAYPCSYDPKWAFCETIHRPGLLQPGTHVTWSPQAAEVEARSRSSKTGESGEKEGLRTWEGRKRLQLQINRLDFSHVLCLPAPLWPSIHWGSQWRHLQYQPLLVLQNKLLIIAPKATQQLHGFYNITEAIFISLVMNE